MFLPKEIIHELNFFLFPNQLMNCLSEDKPVDIDKIMNLLEAGMKLDPAEIINICKKNWIQEARSEIIGKALRAQRAKDVYEKIHRLMAAPEKSFLITGMFYDIKPPLQAERNGLKYFISHFRCDSQFPDKKDYYTIKAVPRGKNNRKEFLVQLTPNMLIRESRNQTFKNTELHIVEI